MKSQPGALQLSIPDPSSITEEPFFRVHYTSSLGARRRSTMFSDGNWTALPEVEKAERHAILLLAAEAFYKSLGCQLLSLEILTHSVSDL